MCSTCADLGTIAWRFYLKEGILVQLEAQADVLKHVAGQGSHAKQLRDDVQRLRPQLEQLSEPGCFAELPSTTKKFTELTRILTEENARTTLRGIIFVTQVDALLCMGL